MALGRAGEDAVVRWYQARGYRVVARNWRHGRGELDLVVTDGRVLVVCEVKTRTSVAYGSGLEAVTADKQRQVRTLGSAFLRARQWRGAVRFDVASVVGGRIEVVQDAF